MLNDLKAGVVVLDSTATVSEANPVASQMLGAAIIGSDWPTLALAKLTATDSPDEWQLAAQRVSIAESPLDSAGGRLLLIHDITVAHELKANLERNERLAAMSSSCNRGAVAPVISDSPAKTTSAALDSAPAPKAAAWARIRSN